MIVIVVVDCLAVSVRYKSCNYFFISFRFQDFSPIDPGDRIRLLDKNFPILFTLMVANYFHPEGFRSFVSRIHGRLVKRLIK